MTKRLIPEPDDGRLCWTSKVNGQTYLSYEEYVATYPPPPPLPVWESVWKSNGWNILDSSWHSLARQEGQVISGIQTEESPVRAHVSVCNQTVYVFDTRDGIEAIKRARPHFKTVTQPGVNNRVTGMGFRVRLEHFTTMKQVPFPDWPGWPTQFEGDVERKGRMAEHCVNALIDRDPFSVFRKQITREQVRDRRTQIKGTDIIIRCADQRLSVKCDWYGGYNGLFLQIAERNYLGKH